jgi:nitrate reductase assembly molybdenum cofactor insertion protein NarJ
MSEVLSLEPSVVDALRDATRWRLLGRLFECPSAEWRADLLALAADVDDPVLTDAATAALAEASEGLYHSVFGPGGPAPPREVSYHDSVELGSVMSSVTGYYRAFGYEPVLLESPDHVAVETGFLAYLRVKQALALVEGDAAHVEVTTAAASTFLTDHMASYAGRLAQILADAPATYLQTASRVLAGWVGPRPGPKMLPVIQPEVEDDGGEFECLA